VRKIAEQNKLLMQRFASHQPGAINFVMGGTSTLRFEAEAWSVRVEGYGGPAQPSPTIAQCLNGGYGWPEIECCRCKTRASMPLDAIRRARDTPIWKLEPSFLLY